MKHAYAAQFWFAHFWLDDWCAVGAIVAAKPCLAGSARCESFVHTAAVCLVLVLSFASSTQHVGITRKRGKCVVFWWLKRKAVVWCVELQLGEPQTVTLSAAMVSHHGVWNCNLVTCTLSHCLLITAVPLLVFQLLSMLCARASALCTMADLVMSTKQMVTHTPSFHEGQPDLH
jgi:hypothetical protein